MANQDELFDFNDEQKELQRLIDQFKVLDTTIMKVSANALAAGKNISSITLPSDLANFTAQNAKLTATIQAQADALSKLQGQYSALVNKKQNSSQRTAEEAVNQAILNKNAMEAARINSTLAGAYTKLSAEQSRASRILQDLISRGKLATQTQREYDKELRNAQKEFDRLNARVLAADRAVGRFNRNVGNYPMQAVKGLKDLLSAFGIVGGLQMFANVAKDIFETTKEIQTMDMALKQVTETQQKFSETQMFLSRISEAYGVDVGKLTQQFTQFYVSAKDKISGNEIENIFESITKAGASMGLSTQQQERAFMALNQMMSKGTIQAEELRGQLGEALPGSLGIMAKAVGVSEKKLGEMMKAGQLLASDVLPKFAKQLEITYGIENLNRINTLASAQNRYTNAWRDFVRGLDEDGNKLSSFMKKAIGIGTDLLIGVSMLLESDQQTRNRTLKNLQESGFNSTMKYYKGLAELKKEDLENDKAYTLQKIKEETEEFNRIKGRNLILKAITPEKANFDVQTDPKLMEKLVKGRAEMSENAKKLNEINNVLSQRKGVIIALNKLLGDDNKVTESNTELTKQQLKAIEDALKAKYDSAKKELELQVLKQETILNSELESYDNQYKALEKSLDLKMKIIKLDYNEQIRLAKGNKDKIRSAEIDSEIATIKQLQEGYSKTKAIRKRQNDEYIAEMNDIEKFIKEYYDDKNEREEIAQEIEERATKSTTDLIDKKIEKLKELKQATKEYTDSFIEEFAGNSGISETFNTFLKQFDDGTGKMTTKFKQLLEGADSPMKKFQTYFTVISESAQEAFNLISELTKKNFDEEKTRLQSQYDIAFEYANGNKEAEEKLADDLEKKKKEIANREAKAKKQQAIYNIVIDTAQAVVASLPNFVLAGLVAALGAVQIAMVSSQKIPQYFKGGTHDGGLMMVNDAPGSNYKETIVYPGGSIAKPEGRNVLMNAPSGTKIYTPDQWDKIEQEKQLFNMLQPRGISMSMQNVSGGFDYQAMDEIMNKYLGNVTVEQTVMDKRGFRSFIKNAGSSTEINRGFASSKGYKFK